MYNDLFTIGRITIHGYGLMTGIGIVMAYLDADHRAKKAPKERMLDSDYILSLFIFCLLFGYLAAKILYWITILPQIIQNPRILLDISDGFVVYGGIIGGLLTVVVYCKRKKLPIFSYMDHLFPSVALAQGFGRIGCFLAGCCYGNETSGSCYIMFSHSDFAPNGIHLIPTQLISSGLDFLNYFVLILLAKRNKVSGRIAAFYLIFYSAGRFVIEFFRGDLIRGSVGALSTSQFISIFVAALGVVMLVLLGKKGNSAKEEE